MLRINHCQPANESRSWGQTSTEQMWAWILLEHSLKIWRLEAPLFLLSELAICRFSTHLTSNLGLITVKSSLIQEEAKCMRCFPSLSEHKFQWSLLFPPGKWSLGLGLVECPSLTSVWCPAGPHCLPLPGFTTWTFLLFRHGYCLLNQGFFTWEQLKKLAQDLDVWKTPPIFHKGLPAKAGVFNWWFVAVTF